MSLSPAADVTRLRHAWRAGDDEALHRLTPVVDELRRLAHARMRDAHPGRIIDTTDLVNEASVRLIEALNPLAAADPRKAQSVELCDFGGLNIDETAEALHVPRQMVIRD